MTPEELQICSKNIYLLKLLINQNFPLTDFINTESKTLYCPFHDDKTSGKPSAQIYKDTDGITRLYCFSENKQYSTYDYIKLILGKNPISYLYNLEVEDLEIIIEEEKERQQKIQNEKVLKIKTVAEKYPKDINMFFKEIYS